MCSALEKSVFDKLWSKKEVCVPFKSWRRDGILAGLDFSHINLQSYSYHNWILHCAWLTSYFKCRPNWAVGLKWNWASKNQPKYQQTPSNLNMRNFNGGIMHILLITLWLCINSHRCYVSWFSATWSIINLSILLKTLFILRYWKMVLLSVLSPIFASFLRWLMSE